ncbi:acyl- n-acyltransferase [Pyrenophora seminiperda CCB06]|uniref:Acyl-n-acyltransferase n=1 Tax=Pyrenophora seminiperda CCB06 TaxID=1302712 RepID=A0A3M7MFE1_9PLEO|nr:acyl- n-acyltransferase [Pyrenophora seminiperda CCB06]
MTMFTEACAMRHTRGPKVYPPYCLRSSLPPPVEISEAEFEPTQDSLESVKPAQGKRNTSPTQWKPFDLEDPEAAKAEEVKAQINWEAQQAEFWSQIEQPNHQTRGNAAASPPPLAPATQPSLPGTPDSNNNNSHTPKVSPYNKSNMSEHPKGKEYIPPHLRNKGKEYIPPHLRVRNRKSTNSSSLAKESVPPPLGNGNSTNESPGTSHKSKPTAKTKFQSSPIAANQHRGAPPSPPSTPKGQEKPSEQDEVVYTGWGTTGGGWNTTGGGWETTDWAAFNQPEGPVDIKKNTGNSRWPRGPQPYKKYVWPKARDMKYIPGNSDYDITYKSNSNGDPDYDVKKLMDWNGDWLPPPESWAARTGYEDRHFGQRIEQWMNNQPPECIQPMFYPQHTFNGRAKTTRDVEKNKVTTEYILDEGQVLKEVAPRYWLEVRIENKSMREAWKQLANSKPGPMDACDLEGHAPWWERYEDVVFSEMDGDVKDEYPSPFINGLEVPDDKIDYNDPENPTEEWHLASAEAKVVEKNRRALAKYNKTMAKRNRVVPEPMFPVPVMPDRRLHPQTNIYLRPVGSPDDVKGITDIYNWYVENTMHAVEFREITEEQMVQRISNVTRQGLPFLVAIDRGNRSRDTNEYCREKIVGYCKLDDYCSPSSLFRYTFEMEIFVHPGFVRKGIGKCLIDRTLGFVNTSYRMRHGYEYINKYDYLKHGLTRVVKTILLNVHHLNAEEVDKGWQSKFLGDFKFRRSGCLPKVGYKQGKCVDVSIYSHITTEDIDANGRPTGCYY